MCFLLSGVAVLAQYNGNRNSNHTRNQPPATVQESFQRDNPNANNTKWQRENGQWHATYKDADRNRNVHAYYDTRGQHRETRMDWDRKDVPSDLDRRINERYHARGRYNVTRIERPDHDPLFQVKLNIGGVAKIVYTDEKGNEVKYRR